MREAAGGEWTLFILTQRRRVAKTQRGWRLEMQHHTLPDQQQCQETVNSLPLHLCVFALKKRL